MKRRTLNNFGAHYIPYMNNINICQQSGFKNAVNWKSTTRAYIFYKESWGRNSICSHRNPCEWLYCKINRNAWGVQFIWHYKVWKRWGLWIARGRISKKLPLLCRSLKTTHVIIHLIWDPISKQQIFPTLIYAAVHLWSIPEVQISVLGRYR